MDPKSLYETLAQYGVIGIMLFIVLYAYHKKDRDLDRKNEEWQKRFDEMNQAWQARLDEETNARIEDAAKTYKIITEVTEKTFQAVHKCADVTEFLMRHEDTSRRDERERPQREPTRHQTGPQKPIR